MIDTLIKLGFHIKREKCILQPSQHFFFLGYPWDTVKVMVKNIQILMGCVISSRPAVF